jgi:hypothetical protein
MIWVDSCGWAKYVYSWLRLRLGGRDREAAEKSSVLYIKEEVRLLQQRNCQISDGWGAVIWTFRRSGGKVSVSFSSSGW